MAVESFAVFAHFAVNQIMKPSPRLSSRSPAAPSCLHSCPGAPPYLLRQLLRCKGWQGLIILFLQSVIEF